MDILDGEGITPTIKDGIFYVPLRPFVELNNGSISWRSDGTKVSADFAIGSYYTVSDGSNEIIEYDQYSDTLSADVFLNENYSRLMVPADAFEKMGYTVVHGDEYLAIYAQSTVTNIKAVSFDNNESAVLGASVEYSFLNDIGDAVISDVSELGGTLSNAAGNMGATIDIKAIDGNVNKATVSFTYDAERLGDVDESDLKIAWFNKLTGEIEVLENSVVDTENKVVSVQTSHFSQYSVIDSNEWVEAWDRTQLIKRDENGLFNINLVLDVSGSMSDSMQLLKDTVINFINGLQDDDFINIITFSNGANTIIPAVQKKNSNYIDIVNSLSSSGGTDMLDGLNSVVFPRIVVTPQTEEDYFHKLRSEATTVTILLSDGEPSDSEEELLDAAERLGASWNGKFISVALGTGANTELMQAMASSANGSYRYIESANDLLEAFELLSGEFIGLNEDTDGDGIPDLIELAGMRDECGNIIITDPYNPDTDGDFLSDGEEMGTFVDEDGGYFLKSSDPTIFTSFQSTLGPQAYNIDQSATVLESYELFGPDTIEYIDIKISVNPAKRNLYVDEQGKTIEQLYSSVINLKFEVTDASECIEVISLPDVIETAEVGESHVGTIRIRCTNSCFECSNSHNIEIKASADNMNAIVINEQLDLRQLSIDSLKTKFEYNVKNALSNEIKEKVSSRMMDLENQTDPNSPDSVLNKMVINFLDDDYTEEIELATKMGVVNLIANRSALGKISLDGAQMVKDSASLIGIIDDETVHVNLHGKNYNIHFDGSFNPKISLFGYVFDIAFLNGECYDESNPEKKYSFTFTKMDEEEMDAFITAYKQLLSDLNNEAWNEAGKESVKALLGAWDMTKLIDEFTEDMLRSLGVFEDVNVFKQALDIEQLFESNASFDDISDYMKDFGDSYNKLNLGETLIDETVDLLLAVFG